MAVWFTEHLQGCQRDDHGPDGRLAAGAAGTATGIPGGLAPGAGRARTRRALASARAEGVSIRTLAAAAGLSPARVHQITAGADLDELDAALGELRAAGWPAPEDPVSAENLIHLMRPGDIR